MTAAGFESLTEAIMYVYVCVKSRPLACSAKTPEERNLGYIQNRWIF